MPYPPGIIGCSFDIISRTLDHKPGLRSVVIEFCNDGHHFSAGTMQGAQVDYRSLNAFDLKVGIGRFTVYDLIPAINALISHLQGADITARVLPHIKGYWWDLLLTNFRDQNGVVPELGFVRTGKVAQRGRSLPESPNHIGLDVARKL